MIWLTWRQFRAQSVVAAAALTVLAITFAVTGPHLSHLYATSGIANCHAQGDCPAAISNFNSQLKDSTTDTVLLVLGSGILVLAPAIIGIFWGAPLVSREIETGTFRLAWNQGVTRTRWLAVKLGLIGLASIATAGLLSLMLTWWASPIYRATDTATASNGAIGPNRFVPVLFGTGGVAPLGYAAFAFALGVTAGVLIHRTLPAMAVTLAIFAAVQIAVPLWIRPHLISPVRVTSAIQPAAIDQLFVEDGGHMTVIAAVNIPGAWILSNQTITPADQPFTGPATLACLSQTTSTQECFASLGKLHLRQVVTYQPASRYWPFQWYEAGSFLALALALAGFCMWWIRCRRIS